MFSSYDTTGYQYSNHTLDTVRIVRDTMINNEQWFISNDGAIRTNRRDGVWFLNKAQPQLGFPIQYGDSISAPSQNHFLEYYIRHIKLEQQIHILGTGYNAEIYDWIGTNKSDPWYNKIIMRCFTVPHLGHVRVEYYSVTPYGTYFLAYSQDLLSTSFK